MADLFEEDFVLPEQMAGPTLPYQTERERWLARQMLRYVYRELLRGARGVRGRYLSRLVNIMAWMDDPDGDRARAAGIPYTAPFRMVAELVPGVSAEAVASGFRTRYREAWEREQATLREAAA